MNTEIGFKCLHYSVAESSGTVKVVVQNFLNKPQTVGVKTRSDTALENDDFEPIDVHVTLPAKGSKTVEVALIDDEGWEPDEDFYVYLYNIGDEAKNQLYGDNTATKVTILDDDKPGKFQFKLTSMQAKRSDGTVQVIIERIDGADGTATCRFKTVEVPSCPNPARPFKDFQAEDKVLTFKAG